RTFNAALVPAQTDALDVEISEEQVSEWYEMHTADYQSEEQVIVEYVELDAAMMEAGEPPAEELLREQYEAQKNRFITPEQRQVSHILIEVAPDASEAEVETARQTAAELAERARAGEDFAALAMEYSQDQGSAPQGGDLGWVEPGVMVDAFEVGMYELSLDNPISDPVQTGFGWHVIQLRDIRESTGMSFEEASVTLIKEYHEDQAARTFLEQADQLVDLVYEDPTTLEHAGLVMGLQVYTEGPFTRSGGEGISAYPEVVEAAFSDLVLLQGSVSDPVNLGENHLVMVRLSEHLPVTTRPLEDVREEIVATLRGNLAREQANARADALLAELQGGESDLETLAAEAELEFGQHEAVQRAAQVPDATLVAEVFRLPAPAEGETIQAVLPTAAGFAVIELLSVDPGQIAEDAPAFMREQYQRVVANSYASQEANALMRQLRDAAAVEIFEERIQ
ncbi:MAG: peptidylprolyl isomerase, partial [Lysobacterales bacterium]